MSGRVVFSLEDIAHWRVREPTTRLILARTDTVPDDIRDAAAAGEGWIEVTALVVRCPLIDFSNLR